MVGEKIYHLKKKGVLFMVQSRVLQENELERIHTKSLEILEEVGVKVEHKKIYQLLIDTGAK